MSNADLATLFSQLANEELASRVASGRLTEEANALAIIELQVRGLEIPVIVRDEEPAPEEHRADMVILERNLTPTGAYLLCSCLQSAGIQADAGDSNAVGGASVRVPRERAAEAGAIATAFRRGEVNPGDDFDSNKTIA